MSTHGNVVQGNGGTLDNAVTQIGSDITLPAGGPWKLHGVTTLGVQHTPTAAQSLQGYIRLDALSGDVKPNLAPAKFPVLGPGNMVSANSGSANAPLNRFDINFEASGKAVIRVHFVNSQANTVAPKIQCALLYGDTIPEPVRFNFIDEVHHDFSGTAEATLGTITLSEAATKIVGVAGACQHAGALAASEEVMAFVRLASDDVQIQPAQFPCVGAANAGLGTVEGQFTQVPFNLLPVDIPVVGGARITCYATTTIAVSNNARVGVFIAYI